MFLSDNLQIIESQSRMRRRPVTPNFYCFNLVDPKLISPPILVGPAYACSNRVKIISFIPFATIEVELNGAIVASQPVGFPEPNGALILLPSALAGGEVLRARQKNGNSPQWLVEHHSGGKSFTGLSCRSAPSRNGTCTHL